MGFDLDQVFAYQTNKVVKVVDRRVGFVYYTIISVVIAYVIGYVFLYDRGYLETEKSTGAVDVKTKGRTFSGPVDDPLYWDAVDLMPSGLERGAVFYGTKLFTTADQIRGKCGNPDRSCTVDQDCKLSTFEQEPIYYPVCENGFCLEGGWCPMENYTATPNKVTSKYDIVGSEAFNGTFFFKATIQFPSLTSTTYSTIRRKQPTWYPEPGYNLLSLTDLLKLTGYTYDDISQYGCILLVNLIWDCDAKQTACEPSISVERLDDPATNSGFNQRNAMYYKKDGVLHRDLTKYFGARIIVNSKGVGHLVSLVAIMTQVGSGIALFGIATVLADLVLRYMLPERKLYNIFKIEETPDFSDVRDDLEELNIGQDKLERMPTHDLQRWLLAADEEERNYRLERIRKKSSEIERQATTSGG